MTPKEVDNLPEMGGIDELKVPVVDGIARAVMSDGTVRERKNVIGSVCIFHEVRPCKVLRHRPTDYFAILDSNGRAWSTGVDADGKLYKSRMSLFDRTMKQIYEKLGPR